jgi:hypothetical protein
LKWLVAIPRLQGSDISTNFDGTCSGGDEEGAGTEAGQANQGDEPASDIEVRSRGGFLLNESGLSLHGLVAFSLEACSCYVKQ